MKPSVNKFVLLLFSLFFLLNLTNAGNTPLKSIDDEDESSSGKESAEMKVINSVLQESEVLKLLRDQAAQQDEKIDQLRIRLNKEITAVQDHFEELFTKISNTEKKLEEDVKKVEDKVYNKVDQVDAFQQANSGGWKIPFFFLFVLVSASAGLYFYMYQKATKHTHYL
eukprot:snap_masked-scaffold_71-processed-gene-0.13-mRNA-1 protein AED:1.00 eAED:1.00 QI:0/-1/0/0/-1/1/1/0/167